MTANINTYQQILQQLKIQSPKTTLLVVSKNRSFEQIFPLINLGHKTFGENRVQEAKLKFTEKLRSDHQIILHLIGPLQSNKASEALQLFSTIQSIDRPKLVDVIIDAKKKLANKVVTKNFYIQVNIGEEPQKAGVAIDGLGPLYDQCQQGGLGVEGLMCIPPVDQNPDQYFNRLLELKNQINPALKLSMGMSQDYLNALKYQSDIIRVGSLLFD